MLALHKRQRDELKDIKLSIIIPVFNEEAQLRGTIREALKAGRVSGLDYEIIIINDCSTDSTAEIATSLAASTPEVQVYHNQTNLGLGGSYKHGVRVAQGTHVTWIPGDESHAADSLEEAYAKTGGADIILPVPTNPKVRSLTRRIISRTYTFLVNSITGNQIPYYNGLSIHRLDLLRNITIETEGFGFQAEIIVKLLKRGATVDEVNTKISDRANGKTKAFKFRNIRSVLTMLFLILLERHWPNAREEKSVNIEN